MNTYYKFIPCNGKEPEGKNGDCIHVQLGDNNRLIVRVGNRWIWAGSDMAPCAADWHHISILTPCEGVLMSREDVGKVWDAAIKYQQDEYDNHEHGLRILAPDKQTTLNNLFSNNKTV